MAKPDVPEKGSETGSRSAFSTALGKMVGAARENIGPILIVTLIFLLALFLRSYYAYDLSASNDWLVSGGSDSYYYERLIYHAVETGEHLHWDAMLNFPDGARNPRPAFYTFSVAVPAAAFQELFSSTADSIGFFFIWSSALWGALTIIPTYMIGREIFGRRTGYIAALFLAIMPTHVERSVATLADHDPFVLFFIVLTIYFLMKSLKTANNSKWINSWLDPKSILSGLRGFAIGNRTAILYSLLAGLSFAGIAMAWVGFTYVEVILLAFFLVQVLINKFKGIDSTALTLLFFIMFSFAFLLSFPVYYQMLMYNVRFDIPLFLFLASVVFGLLFMITRDYPWVLVLPVLGVLIGVAVFIITIVDPALGEAIFTGQGYFFKSKLYETIAEARAPGFSELAVSFGVVTFVLSFVGLFIMLSKIPKRVSGDFIIVSIWMAIAIFMAGSAGRFMFNAAPAFALSSAWATFLIIRRLDFKRIAKLFAGSSGSITQAFRKSVKLRHVLGALFIVFMLIVPNVWFAIDAGIPNEKKGEIDAQIYHSLPTFLRPDDYSGGYWYLGAFGYSLPMPNNYFPAYWDWFSQQDQEILPEYERPAYVSWWDYGFEAIQDGRHPTVADNFQQGYQIAGDILLSRSEEEALGLMIARTVNAHVYDNGGEITPELSAVFADYGVSSAEVRDVIRNTSKYKDDVLADPIRYGSAMSDISNLNVLWRYLGMYFADLGIESEVMLYQDLKEYTGFSIGYIGVDSRLIQKSARDGSVFYAPVKLTDRKMDSTGNPVDYYRIKAVDDQGIEWDLDDPGILKANIVDYALVYQSGFFDTMLYKAFVGITPSELGKQNDGLPGLSGSVQSENVAPGYNLTHFMMVYRTAYYNPESDGSGEWRAISLDEAIDLNKEIQEGANGIVDMSARSYYQVGAVMLEYYEGAVLSGQVTDMAGDPAPGVRITVLDRYNIPHQSVLSDSDGSYSLILPPGQDMITISTGELDSRNMVGENLIRQYYINITDEQAARKPVDRDGDGIQDWDITQDEVVSSSRITGYAYWDVNRDSNFTQTADTLIATGTITARNLDNNLTYEGTIQSGAFQLILSPGSYEVDTFINSIEKTKEFVIDLEPGETFERNIARIPTSVSGKVMLESGANVPNAEVYMNVESGDAPEETYVLVTDSSGSYSFDFLPSGTYFLYAKYGYMGTFGQYVTTTVSNHSKALDFVLRPTGTLQLSVIDDAGHPIANASVKVSNAYDPTDSTTVFMGADGKTEVAIPIGTYSVTTRLPRGENVLVGGISAEIRLEKVTTATLSAMPGVLVSGKVSTEENDKLYPEQDVEISFTFGDIRFYTATDTSGEFEVWLPAGEYEVVFSQEEMRTIYTQLLSAPVEEEIDITLVQASMIAGTVWHDRNGDSSMDEEEVVAYPFIRVLLANGVTIRSRGALHGNYSILVPKNDEVYLMAGGQGYKFSTPESVTSSLNEISKAVELDLAVVSVEGMLLLDGKPLRGVSVSFINGTNVNTFKSGLYGSFSGELLPAVYSIRVEQQVSPGSPQYYFSDLVTVVYVGVDIPNLVVEVQKRLKVEGAVTGIPEHESAEVFFKGLEGGSETGLESTGSFQTYLAEGEYVCYAYNMPSKDMSALFHMTVTPYERYFEIDLVDSFLLSGYLNFGDEKGNYTILEIADAFTGANITIEIPANGGYSLALPPTTYELSFLLRYLEEIPARGRFLYLTNHSTIALDSDIEFIPLFDYGLDNSTLEVNIVDKWGNPVMAEVNFYSNNKYGFSYSYVSDRNGRIESTIHPGAYAVYVADATTGLAYFDLLGVALNQPAHLNITLTKGYRVVVAANADNSTDLLYMRAAVIEKDSRAKYQLANEGSGNQISMVLPEGSYTLEIDASRFVNGKLVPYSLSQEVSINSDKAINLKLEKEYTYDFKVSWDSTPKRSIDPGDAVTYYLTITNTGNAADSYTFSSSAEGFELSFPEDKVTADFGTQQNTVTVPVGITADPDALADHADIIVTVKSSGSSAVTKDVALDVDIRPVYSVDLQVTDSSTINGTSFSRIVKIVNGGNVYDNFTIVLTNLEELSMNGWSVYLDGSTDTILTTDDLAPGSEKTVNITFTAWRVNPNSNISATIVATSNSSAGVYAYASASPLLPDLSFDPKDELTIDGDNIHMNDIFSQKATENLFLLIALAILVASIFIVRKIKFGRFLR